MRRSSHPGRDLESSHAAVRLELGRVGEEDRLGIAKRTPGRAAAVWNAVLVFRSEERSEEVGKKKIRSTKAHRRKWRHLLQYSLSIFVVFSHVAIFSNPTSFLPTSSSVPLFNDYGFTFKISAFDRGAMS